MGELWRTTTIAAVGAGLLLVGIGSLRAAATRAGAAEAAGRAFAAPGADASARASAARPDYDIVYVRQPRYGDDRNTTWPEVSRPALLDPGADLMLLHPDGTEEVLVAGGDGAVTDPFVSFDGRSVYFSYFYDVRPEAINPQRRLPRRGADIFRMDLRTREVVQLTHGEFTPNTGAGDWDESNPLDPGRGHDALGYGIFNLGAAPVAGGKIAFTSNRNGFSPPRGYTNPTMQLFVMDEDGGNVTQIAPMNIGSALHPTPLVDGRLIYSSLETQGIRDVRVWGLWSIQPDGRAWGPVVSAFRGGQAFHFATQLSSGDIVVVDYYNMNCNGFGALYRLPVTVPAGAAPFDDAFASRSRPIEQTVAAGYRWPFKLPFAPHGIRSITPFTNGEDQAAPIGRDGRRVGKFTHPSAAPADDLLVVWTPGPANDLARPTSRPFYDGGIYLIPRGETISGPEQLVTIKNDPRYNEAWPRAVVPYRAIHGVNEPRELPWLPNDGTAHPALPAGTPYGLVGTSSFYKRESSPGLASPSATRAFDGLDPFNSRHNGQSANWAVQGADAGKYDDDDIWAVRVVAQEPNTHHSYGPNAGPSGRPRFFSHAMERLRILGEIPLRKTGPDGRPVLDPEGNPDTSFLARIPADTPFTFQTLDRNGMVLNMAQTWHQVRPGEVRADCGGCHAHSKRPLAFEDTAAARPDYAVVDLVHATPLVSPSRPGARAPGLRVARASVVDVEFFRDIRPILRRSCVPCHTGSAAEPPAGLVLDDETLYHGLPGDYARLANDTGARWGTPPVIGRELGWRGANASRYVRRFQSRRSLLVWKVFGARLDGWRNEDHPTERVPGDPATLPAGADPSDADLDFTGTIMPPPESGVPPLSEEEKLTIARWIDLGCPIDRDRSDHGWFADDLRPTVALGSPRAGLNEGPLGQIRVGLADAASGVDLASVSITADIAIAGRAPGAELADLLREVADGIWAVELPEPLHAVSRAHLRVAVRDRRGNVTRVERRFSVRSPTPWSPASGARVASPAPSASSASPARVASAAARGETARPARPEAPAPAPRRPARVFVAVSGGTTRPPAKGAPPPPRRRAAAGVVRGDRPAPVVSRSRIVERLEAGESVEALCREVGADAFWREVARSAAGSSR